MVLLLLLRGTCLQTRIQINVGSTSDNLTSSKSAWSREFRSRSVHVLSKMSDFHPSGKACILTLIRDVPTCTQITHVRPA